MALAPLIPIVVITLSFVFQAALGNTEAFTDSFPTMSELEAQCDGSGIADTLSCIFGSLIWGLQFLIGLLVFFLKFLGFYIPGAPWYVQAVLSSVSIGWIGWSIAELFRGT